MQSLTVEKLSSFVNKFRPTITINLKKVEANA